MLGKAGLAAVAIMLAIGPESGVSAQQSPARTLMTLGEVRNGDAMKLASRLLDARIRERIVDGHLRRQFMPGHHYVAWYTDAPVATSDGFCRKDQYHVYIRQSWPFAEDAAPATLMSVGDVEKSDLVALPLENAPVTDTTCRLAQGFVELGSGPDLDKRKAAYRRLIATIRVAAGRRTSDLRFVCTPANDPACADPRASFAHLPLNALSGIDVRSNRTQVLYRTKGVRVLQAEPVAPGEPYDVEVAFGPAEGARSWRIRWRSDDAMTVAMDHADIIYH